MGPIPLLFDVTDALPAEVTQGQRLSIAAWLFFPDDPQRLGPKPVVMALLNGGSYDKRYFHIEIPGYPGYSAAEHLAALGNIVLLPDHLGIGESSRAPEQKKATRQVVALANHLAVTQFYDRLRTGSIHPKLPAIRKFVKIGGGHSMGGMQTITQQAEFGTYEAVMILGYTVIGCHFTVKGKLVRVVKSPSNADTGDYALGNREFFHETFHWDDVAPAIVEADDAMAVETPSVMGMESLDTDSVSKDAGRIDVPTYLCFGERDVSPDPHGEPGYYKRCRDLTLHILPRSGHCHNFASTRHQLWNRMHNWTHCLSN